MRLVTIVYNSPLKMITGIKLLLKILRRTENAEYSRFVLAEKISEMIYPKYKFSKFGRLFLEDKAFMNRNCQLMDYSSSDFYPGTPRKRHCVSNTCRGL